MLKLTLDLQIEPKSEPLPAHLGGALHGFVEGSIKHHAPHLLPVLRPQGPNSAAHFMITPPPYGETVEQHMRFAVIFYGTSARAWPVLLRALIEQQTEGLNNRRIRIDQAWYELPGEVVHPLLEQGQLLQVDDGRPITRNPVSLVEMAPAAAKAPVCHRLAFRSPLLLASRKALRERIADGLPWPRLGSVLDSIADRMRTLEPELADALGLAPGWRAPEICNGAEAYTPANAPARQMTWKYTSKPRQTDAESASAERRTLIIPGIVGELAYPACGVEHERDLLYWGQWLGVGQKTTMGCGGYLLSQT